MLITVIIAATLALTGGTLALPSGLDLPRAAVNGWTMNASIASGIPGCVILAQLTTSTPIVIQSMIPICPSTVDGFASQPATGLSVNWPFSSTGNGSASQLAIYGQVKHVQNRDDPYQAQAGCVMQLSNWQVMYLLGRSLTWNNNLTELWDNTANGFIMQNTTGPAMKCTSSSTLLPSALWLPCPYMFPATDPSFNEPITLNAFGEGATTSTPTTIPTSTTTPTPTTAPTPTITSEPATTLDPVLAVTGSSTCTPMTVTLTTTITLKAPVATPPTQ